MDPNNTRGRAPDPRDPRGRDQASIYRPQQQGILRGPGGTQRVGSGDSNEHHNPRGYTGHNTNRGYNNNNNQGVMGGGGHHYQRGSSFDGTPPTSRHNTNPNPNPNNNNNQGSIGGRSWGNNNTPYRSGGPNNNKEREMLNIYGGGGGSSEPASHGNNNRMILLREIKHLEVEINHGSLPIHVDLLDMIMIGRIVLTIFAIRKRLWVVEWGEE